MARIAILSDIHGNLPALRAVLADLERQDLDEVLVGGDLVGRGPQGSQVIEEVRARGWRTVRGNHEEYLLDFRRRRVPDDWLSAPEWAASRWMAAELSADDVEFIAGLPGSLEIKRPAPMLVLHGSPRSTNEGLGPWTSDRKLERHVDGIRASTLVCAHTHRPMERPVANGLVVNVGSVGLPFNRDRRAQYAVFHSEGDGWRPEFRQVDYDLEETLRAYAATGFLERGGVTVRLLELELREAVPYLVPFQKWARLLGHPMESSAVDRFMDLYDPDESLQAFSHGLLERPRAGSERAD